LALKVILKRCLTIEIVLFLMIYGEEIVKLTEDDEKKIKK